MESPDLKLIRDFAERREETAFAELVRRHVDLVYSAACRVTQDPDLARDVTQKVFADFARKIPTWNPQVVPPAWLYRAALNCARNERRREIRRKLYEHEAMKQAEPGDGPAETGFLELLPLLDDALEQLDEEDRQVLVMRFLSRSSLRSVGEALGIGEDGARKRVNRAGQRLRQILERQGRLVSEAAVVAALAALGAQTAPPALAAAVLGSALAASTTAPLVAAPWLLSATTVVLVSQALVSWQGWRLEQIQQEVAAREAQLAITFPAETDAGVMARESAAAELTRLRQTALDLRRQLAVSPASANSGAISPAAPKRVVLQTGRVVPWADLDEAGSATPEAMVQSMLAAERRGNVDRYVEFQLLDRESRQRILKQEHEAEARDRWTTEAYSAKYQGAEVLLLAVAEDGPDRVRVRLSFLKLAGTDSTDEWLLGRTSQGWRKLPIALPPSSP